MSRELESVQRLAIGLFWSGLSNLITIPDCSLLLHSTRSTLGYPQWLTESERTTTHGGEKKGLLLSFGKIRSRGYHSFLEVRLVGFDFKLIALGVIYNLSHPLPGQFHYCFNQRGVLWDIHNG